MMRVFKNQLNDVMVGFRSFEILVLVSLNGTMENGLMDGIDNNWKDVDW